MKTYLKLILLFAAICSPAIAEACTTCNREVQEGIYNDAFFPNLLAMFSPFIILAIIVVALAVMAEKRYQRSIAGHEGKAVLTPVPLTTAATVLGIGLGGFADGIVLHQLLQWHEMVSNRLPPTNLTAKTINMFWDGVFHAFCFVVTLTGVILVWRLLGRSDIDRSGRLLTGGLLLGWGIFNIVEGILDHHILKVHNVNDFSPNPAVWNYGFLGFSIVLIIIGYVMVRVPKKAKLADE